MTAHDSLGPRTIRAYQDAGGHIYPLGHVNGIGYEVEISLLSLGGADTYIAHLVGMGCGGEIIAHKVDQGAVYAAAINHVLADVETETGATQTRLAVVNTNGLHRPDCPVFTGGEDDQCMCWQDGDPYDAPAAAS